jgi:DNA-binding response OmpR family regulator
MAQVTIRVLLMENDPGDALMIEGMLSSETTHRFDWQHFETLQAGLEGLRMRHVDVVLLDLSLPDSDGLSTLSKVIAAGAGVPIIVLAGPEVTPAVEERIKIGGRVFLRKAQLTLGNLVEAILEQTGRGRSNLSGTDLSGSGRERPDSGTRPTVRVLVVEDNYGDLALIRLMLGSEKSAHFEIIHASKLASAFEALDRGADVMLLDLSLPDSNGLHTLQRVRARDAVIPIIILTGAEDRQKAVESLANGAQDYFVKGKVDGYLLARTILRRVNIGQAARKQSPGRIEGTS